MHKCLALLVQTRGGWDKLHAQNGSARRRVTVSACYFCYLLLLSSVMVIASETISANKSREQCRGWPDAFGIHIMIIFSFCSSSKWRICNSHQTNVPRPGSLSQPASARENTYVRRKQKARHREQWMWMWIECDADALLHYSKYQITHSHSQCPSWARPGELCFESPCLKTRPRLRRSLLDELAF